MKKIAALLALVICLLAAVPAMAMRTNMVRISLHPGWRQLLPEEGIANTEGNGIHKRLRVELTPLEKSDLHPGTTPDLDDTENALLAAAKNALNPGNGETMYYSIMNAQAQIEKVNDYWEDTNIPDQEGDEHQYQRLGATIPFNLFDQYSFDSNDRIAAFVASTDEPTKWENVKTASCYDRVNSEGAGMLYPHLTPMIFAWVPQEDPTAKPLDPPQNDPDPDDPPQDEPKPDDPPQDEPKPDDPPQSEPEPAATPIPTDAAENLPATGDDGNLAMLFVLLGVSVAALGAMKLRRREN